MFWGKKSNLFSLGSHIKGCGRSFKFYLPHHKDIEVSRTRLHQAPVFNTYKPNNERAKQNVLYRGAILWNGQSATDGNKNFKDFKSSLYKHLI